MFLQTMLPEQGCTCSEQVRPKKWPPYITTYSEEVAGCSMEVSLWKGRYSEKLTAEKERLFWQSNSSRKVAALKK